RKDREQETKPRKEASWRRFAHKRRKQPPTQQTLRAGGECGCYRGRSPNHTKRQFAAPIAALQSLDTSWLRLLAMIAISYSHRRQTISNPSPLLPFVAGHSISVSVAGSS